MAEHVCFLVHGMGKAGANWEQDPIATFDATWAMIPELEHEQRADYLEFVPLEYDSVWEQYLGRVTDGAEGLKDVVDQSAINSIVDAFQGADDEDKNFFWSHVFDVLLYRFGGDLYRAAHVKLLHEMVSFINDRWDTRPNTKFSVIAYSLGTAVMHGALNRLAAGPIGRRS